MILLVFHHVKEPGPSACIKPCIFMQWPLATFWDRVLFWNPLLAFSI